MFIQNPDPYLLPSYLISPFNTGVYKVYSKLPEDGYFEEYCNQRFGVNNWLLTLNGREAIQLALSLIEGLSSKHIVTVLTTTQNFYISSCVTKTIENNAAWNRDFSDSTDVVFVNHEFGFPMEQIAEFAEGKLPLIEDCCTTFFSQDNSKKIGKYGRFSVYSFPKFFPIQIGGLLVGENIALKGLKTSLTKEEANFVNMVLSHCLKNENEILSKRLQVYHNLVEKFGEMGLVPRIPLKPNVYPSAFLFKSLENQEIDWAGLKTYCWNHGIQSSVFYGENAFFIPCHQNLSKEDIDYFAFVVKSFIERK
jgi:dTDP-4-amino-4,6-dideoxygalactose transaminase